MKRLDQGTVIFIIFGILLVAIVLIFSTAGAAPAPTRTPVAVEGTPEPEHWQLLEDGAQAYLLTHPECFLGLQDLGGGAYHLELDCDPQ